MHKFRREAKYAAWYDKDGDPHTYNPFRKVRTNSKTSNRPKNVERELEEGKGESHQAHGGLHERALSDPDFRPESAVQRERDFGQPPPRHAATLPDSDTSSPTHYETTDDINFQQRVESPIAERSLTEKDGGMFGENTTAEPKDSTSSNTIVPTNEDNSENKPRVRGKFKGLFKKKKHDESEAETQDLSPDDEEKPKTNFTFASQIRATLLNSWINVLLVAVPVGIALKYAGVSAIIVFVVNFIAIIPLAAMLSYATEEIALRTGETIGGLLNATFGNAVELIVGIIALVQDQVLVVKTSLIGSMLSNLLLVMGMCFFFGGLNRVEQKFNVVVAQTASSLLALAIGSLIIPTAFAEKSTNDGSNGSSVAERESNLAPLSRGTAVILLVVYACYLFFQLKTHIDIYNAPSEKTEKRKTGKKDKGDASRGIANIGGAFAASTQGEQVKPNLAEQEEDEAETPQLHIYVAFATLAISTVLVALCAEFMVDSIDAVSEHISKTFVGLILLPIVGNAAEHATAVTVAVKDKMDLAIGVAVGSSMQIALLVLPLMVILGWITGHNDMTLFFDTFQIAVLFISILLVNYLIMDGKSHWLEGVLLQTLYILIALACWFYG